MTSSEAGDPRVSVVMITFNRVGETLRTLEHLTRLPERPRVVVVDNGSVDGTSGRIAGRFPGVEVIRLESNRGAAGRTLGVLKVDTPYVAFCDDDTWWDPGHLSRAADLLDVHPRVAVLTGHILVGPEDREDPINAEMAESPLPDDPDLPGRPLLSFLAGASILRREAYLEAGGFEPRLFLGGEEELLATDLISRGWALRYVPRLVVHHHPSTTRDAHDRRKHGIRNTLWFTWMRRPIPSALRRTLRMARSVPRDRISVEGFAAALAGLPWVLRHRRVVPPEVERLLRLMDDPQMTSKARRYIS